MFGGGSAYVHVGSPAKTMAGQVIVFLEEEASLGAQCRAHGGCAHIG